MAKPDMTKTVDETFRKVPSPQGLDTGVLRPDPTQEEIEALMKKPRSKMTDEEREMVEDYHLDSRERLAKSTFSPDIRVPERGAEPAERAASEKPSETPSALERAASGTVDTLTRFGEEVADLPAELYQSHLERKGAEERRLAEIEAAKMRPNKPTPEGWAALREIDAEIERLQQSRKESSNPGEVYWEIEKLKKKRQQIPGVFLPPADMEDEGARTSYEDYLLRK